MTKKIAFSIIAAVMTLGLFSCNSDEESGSYAQSNVAITAFSLAANEDILSGLDSIFFSIDLKNACIYNADSLPKGTDISRMIINIATSNASAAQLIISRKNASDTTINYFEHSTDSVDFSNGPITVRLTAADKLTTRDYRVSVNVSTSDPDSLFWNRLSRKYIPSTLDMTKQKTVQLGGTTYCLTTDGSEFCVMSTTDIHSNKWNILPIAYTFTPNIYTFTATNDMFYVLDLDGNLYSSADAITWNECGEKWSHIYGGYEDSLLGVKKDGYDYFTVTYPATQSTKIDADFPVSGTSQLLTFATKWSDKPQAIMIGGKTSDGRKLSNTWAYDGDRWAKINAHSPIHGLTDMTLVPYYTFDTDTLTWNTSKFPTLLAMFGRNEGGLVERTVYISRDQGMHWKKGDQSLQLPEYIPSMDKAQAFVVTETMHSRSLGGWETMPNPTLPRWWTIEMPYQSRAITPITEWETPFIYLFGGEDDANRTTLFMWRGVINRLTFKPIN